MGFFAVIHAFLTFSLVNLHARSPASTWTELEQLTRVSKNTLVKAVTTRDRLAVTQLMKFSEAQGLHSAHAYLNRAEAELAKKCKRLQDERRAIYSECMEELEPFRTNLRWLEKLATKKPSDRLPSESVAYSVSVYYYFATSELIGPRHRRLRANCHLKWSNRNCIKSRNELEQTREDLHVLMKKAFQPAKGESR